MGVPQAASAAGSSAFGSSAFQATEVSTQRLRFENPQHDFPRAIEYERTSPDSLIAKVYGEIGSSEPAFVLLYARRAC